MYVIPLYTKKTDTIYLATQHLCKLLCVPRTPIMNGTISHLPRLRYSTTETNLQVPGFGAVILRDLFHPANGCQCSAAGMRMHPSELTKEFVDPVPDP